MVSSELSQPRAIGFDIDHTLVVDNKLERVAFQRLLEVVLDAGGAARGTLEQETECIDALLEEQRAGAFTIDEAVRRFVSERGIAETDPYAERFRAMAIGMVEQFVVPLPGAKRTLEVLRERGYRIAVLSNGWNPLQIHKARRAGFVGPVLASADIGCQKPHAGAFDALLRCLGTAPAFAWYVGDDPRGDVDGARRAGLEPIWMNGDGRRFPRDMAPPRYAVVNPEGLLEIFPARRQAAS